ncbi:ThiF family protein [Babesia bovis T2Bo]|uniref:ThiF family protein n=1 Tax=Babesia bovis T2Bo TaxID=484906 RepID=UPI001C369BA2|nr:ThiF family protein [Babesia bovis T2Bo]EDO05109.2 ThiF family protein [Babesia bovis T2Bo]
MELISSINDVDVSISDMFDDSNPSTSRMLQDSPAQFATLVEHASSADNLCKSSGTNDFKLSGQDALLYDRQIRLWGIEAQQKIMRSNTLLLGKNGILEETMKNLILSGMRVTFANDVHVTPEDVANSFFLRESDIGNNHAESLVSRMRSMASDKHKVTFFKSTLLEDNIFNDLPLSHNIDFDLKQFDAIVCAMESYDILKLIHLDEICRTNGIAFFASKGNYTQGFFFQDLNIHTVSEKMSRSAGNVIINYRSLKDALSEPQLPNRCDDAIRTVLAYILMQKEHLNMDYNFFTRDHHMDQLQVICNKIGASVEGVLQHVKNDGKYFSITSAVLGGYIALEIRKFITKQHETIPSLCVFDMERSTVVTSMV